MHLTSAGTCLLSGLQVSCSPRRRRQRRPKTGARWRCISGYASLVPLVSVGESAYKVSSVSSLIRSKVRRPRHSPFQQTRQSASLHPREAVGMDHCQAPPTRDKQMPRTMMCAESFLPSPWSRDGASDTDSGDPFSKPDMREVKILLEFELLLSFSARNSMPKQVSQAIVGVRSTSWQGLAQRLGVNDKPPSGPVQGRRMNIPTIVERARFLSSLYCHQVPLGLMKAPGLLCCGNKVWRSEETGDHDIRHARCLAQILAILPGHAGLQRPPVSLSCKRPSQDQDTEIR